MSMHTSCTVDSRAIQDMLRLMDSQALTSLLLMIATASTYDLGSDEPVCWATIPDSLDGPQRVDCNGTTVEFLSNFPTFVGSELFVSTPYDFEFRARIPPARGAVLREYTKPGEDGKDFFDVSHGNIHMCLETVGFCTPFVLNTPGLSTHSPEKRCVLDEQGVCTMISTMQLDVLASYTAIAHVRWYDSAGVKHDVARARLAVRVVPKPETVAEAEARLGSCHALRDASPVSSISAKRSGGLTSGLQRVRLEELSFASTFETWFDQDKPQSSRLISSLTLQYRLAIASTQYRDPSLDCDDLILPDLVSDQFEPRPSTLLAVSYTLTDEGAQVTILRRFEFWLTIDPLYYPFDVHTFQLPLRTRSDLLLDNCTSATLTGDNPSAIDGSVIWSLKDETEIVLIPAKDLNGADDPFTCSLDFGVQRKHMPFVLGGFALDHLILFIGMLSMQLDVLDIDNRLTLTSGAILALVINAERDIGLHGLQVYYRRLLLVKIGLLLLCTIEIILCQRLVKARRFAVAYHINDAARIVAIWSFFIYTCFAIITLTQQRNKDHSTFVTIWIVLTILLCCGTAVGFGRQLYNHHRKHEELVRKVRMAANVEERAQHVGDFVRLNSFDGTGHLNRVEQRRLASELLQAGSLPRLQKQMVGEVFNHEKEVDAEEFALAFERLVNLAADPEAFAAARKHKMYRENTHSFFGHSHSSIVAHEVEASQVVEADDLGQSSVSLSGRNLEVVPAQEQILSALHKRAVRVTPSRFRGTIGLRNVTKTRAQRTV